MNTVKVSAIMRLVEDEPDEIKFVIIHPERKILIKNKGDVYHYGDNEPGYLKGIYIPGPDYKDPRITGAKTIHTPRIPYVHLSKRITTEKLTDCFGMDDDLILIYSLSVIKEGNIQVNNLRINLWLTNSSTMVRTNIYSRMLANANT